MLSSQKWVLRVAAGVFTLAGAALLGAFWMTARLAHDPGADPLQRAAPQLARSIERQLRQTVTGLELVRASIDTERGAGALSPVQQERLVRATLRALLASQPAMAAAHYFAPGGQTITEPATRRAAMHPLAAEPSPAIAKSGKAATDASTSLGDAVVWRFDSTTAEPVLVAQLPLRDLGERTARIAVELTFNQLIRRAGDGVSANARYAVSTGRGDAVAVAERTEQSWQVHTRGAERIGVALGRPGDHEQLTARLAVAGRWNDYEFEPLQMVEMSVAALPRAAGHGFWPWFAIGLAVLAAALTAFWMAVQRALAVPTRQMFEALRQVRKGADAEYALQEYSLPVEWREAVESMAEAHHKLRRKYAALKSRLHERDEAIALRNEEISKVRSVLHAKTVEWATNKAEDDLTGLPNRRQFKRIVQDEWRRSARSKQPMTLALIHIDGFQQLVERNGREAGEELLLSMASLLRGTFRRAGDLIARSSIDQFAVLMPGIEPSDVLPHVQEMRQRILLTFTPSGSADAPARPTTTVSVGISGTTPNPRDSWRMLAQIADSALQKAVQDGGNCVRLVEAPAALTVDPAFDDLIEVPDAGGLMVNPKLLGALPKLEQDTDR